MLGFIGFGGTEFFRRELTRMMEMMPSGSSNPVRGERDRERDAWQHGLKANSLGLVCWSRDPPSTSKRRQIEALRQTNGRTGCPAVSYQGYLLALPRGTPIT